MGRKSGRKGQSHCRRRALFARPHHVVCEGEVHVPGLVVDQASRVEDIIGDGKVDHSAVIFRKAQGRRKKSNRGAVIMIENFTLEGEIGSSWTFGSLSRGWTSELWWHQRSWWRVRGGDLTPPLGRFPWGRVSLIAKPPEALVHEPTGQAGQPLCPPAWASCVGPPCRAHRWRGGGRAVLRAEGGETPAPSRGSGNAASPAPDRPALDTAGTMGR